MRERVIFGASSAIAEAIAKHWARHGDRLTLVGRNAERLGAIAKDLQSRGASRVEVSILDFTNLDDLALQVEELFAEKDRVDTLLVAPGFLGFGELEHSPAKALQVWNINFQLVAVILLAARSHFVKNSFGTMAAFAAPEADLGRASTYFYGSAKAALRVFLSGLREELASKNVRVATLNPGRVITPLNQDVSKAGRNWISPDQVAEMLVYKIDGGGIVYAPFYWRAISWFRRSLPESLARQIKF